MKTDEKIACACVECLTVFANGEGEVFWIHPAESLSRYTSSETGMLSEFEHRQYRDIYLIRRKEHPELIPPLKHRHEDPNQRHSRQA